ncbi:hypothetical protein IM739_17600 [Rhizobium sp. SL42]|nr:hypothetical protein IM739_17600 [Rhizobium sp. SL42]
MPVPGRACGPCSLCCILPDIDELDKPANVVCRHCVPGGGCLSYAVRPQTCRDFLCLWRTEPGLAAHWDPAASHMMIYVQGRQTTVLVDPAHPAIWQREPYFGELRQRAAEAKRNGGYLIVYVGDEVTLVD